MELIWGNESNSKFYLTRNRFVMSGIECKFFPEKEEKNRNYFVSVANIEWWNLSDIFKRFAGLLFIMIT